MRKLILITFFFSGFFAPLFAQVGIGTTTPSTSSVLELNSTNKAFILPRMTTLQRDQIANPVAGMEIFNITTSCNEIYRGSSWYNLCSGAVITSGPNLVQGGDMSDESKWTRFPIYAGVNLAFTGGKAIFTGGKSAPNDGAGHYGMYQAINIEAGKNYQIDMHVNGTNIKNTWLEVYIGAAVPTTNIDYVDGGKRLALNTWDCAGANTTFDAQLNTITCVTGKWNNIIFPSSGVVYLMIRCGGDDLTLTDGTGVTVDNVDFHSTN